MHGAFLFLLHNTPNPFFFSFRQGKMKQEWQGERPTITCSLLLHALSVQTNSWLLDKDGLHPSNLNPHGTSSPMLFQELCVYPFAFPKKTLSLHLPSLRKRAFHKKYCCTAPAAAPGWDKPPSLAHSRWQKLYSSIYSSVIFFFLEDSYL